MTFETDAILESFHHDLFPFIKNTIYNDKILAGDLWTMVQCQNAVIYNYTVLRNHDKEKQKRADNLLNALGIPIPPDTQFLYYLIWF